MNAPKRSPNLKPAPEQTAMIEKYQCPGCVAGSDTECGSYLPDKFADGVLCGSHTPGTRVLGGGAFALGLPTGFNKWIGRYRASSPFDYGEFPVILVPEGGTYIFDRYNVAVWALEKDGALFIRCFSPRLGRAHVVVIEGGKRKKLCPNAVDVAEFIDDMD